MFVIANWKMNPNSLAKALDLFFNTVKWLNWLPKNSEQKIIICPPFIWLGSITQKYKKYLSENILLGAQDVNDQESGPHTGDISAAMLRDTGCQYVIIGHSERRSRGENDIMINKKIKIALSAGLNPILCIGETKFQRRNKQTKTVIKKQLKAALLNIDFEGVKKIIIAYEPVWAIGKMGQKSIDSQEAGEMKEFIKSTVSLFAGKKNNIPVLYGGSVDSKNVNNFVGAKLMDGVLVGTSSLDYKEFISIAKTVLGCL